MGFFDSISSGFSSAWSSIKDFGGKAVNGISDAGKAVFNWGKDNIPEAASKVANFAGMAYQNEIKPAITTIYTDISGLAKTATGGIAKLEGGAGDFLSNGLTPILLGAVAIGAFIFLKK
jgi:hypothetical protein